MCYLVNHFNYLHFVLDNHDYPIFAIKFYVNVVFEGPKLTRACPSCSGDVLEFWCRWHSVHHVGNF